MLVKASGIVECLSDAADLSDGMNNHHHRVACIAAAIGEAFGLSKNKFENLIAAAALHDIGGLGVNAGLDLFHFDSLDEGSECHCRRGALLVKKFRPFAHLAPIIRHHHAFWNQRHDGDVTNVPVESRILFLADRVAVLMTDKFRLDGVYDIRDKVYGRRGSLFMPEAVDAFIEVSRRESFWFEARDAVIQPLLEDTLSRNLYLDCEDLLGLGKLFSQTVDFRNSYMASHSPAVASVADTLAELCGFSRDELVAIRLAGLLHDIGKLAVTEAVLEKSGQLTAEESEKMKSHAYYTNRLLLKIREFDAIRGWASLHHERLDGSGYPYRLKGESLPLGSRILAVADVFVALTEDRPYRSEMNRLGLTGILESLANKGALDRNLIRLLLEHYDTVDDRKRAEQKLARLEYGAFCVPDCSEAAASEDVRLRRTLVQAPG